MNRQGWKALEAALSRLRPHREPLSLLVDGVVIWLAWQATYLFRLGFDRWLSARPVYDLIVSLAVVAAYLIVFKALRLPAGVWRFTGFGDIRRLALGCVAAGLFCGLLISPLLQLSKVPRAVLALHPFISLMGVCLARLLYRMLFEHLQARLHGPREPLRPALVLGAGEAAKRLIAGIQGQGWQVLGLLDDDPAKRGARVAGLPVLGPTAQLAEQVERSGATHLILAMPSVQGAARRRLIERASATGLPLLTVPSSAELREGSRVHRVRDIEPEDLLGREPVQLDEAGIETVLRGKVAAVTGAGGSIGAELCAQIAHYRPSALLLIEASEYALYRVEQMLRERHPELALLPRMADVKDQARLTELFTTHRPATVFHAAAYKHVPLMEVGNAQAALHNNALGTWSAGQAAAAAGAERFVLVSTDKAVNPTSVMGASKRLAELAVLQLARREAATRFMAVRFGNVLGSSGSVIPHFKDQIARGGPVTVTHPDIIRYFMTITEAARLVLQAAAIGQSGQVLVLDMGEPVRIADLARSMIALSGHTADEIAVVYTGLRPGEKLYEELLADSERTVPTACRSLRVARLGPTDVASGDSTVWVDEARRLEPGDDARVRAFLQRWIPEYTPAA